MHTLSASFVLGYHGCDQSVAKQLLDGDSFKPSNNEHDWLGPGIYFWEANPQRGLDFAEELAKSKRGKGKVSRPAVVGAVIDLGLCLDLTTAAGIKHVSTVHKGLPAVFKAAGRTIPQNNEDGLLRNLDCAVITMLHEMRRNADDPAIDSVKGIFIEGNPIYVNSGFHEKTHIQICVCNPEQIKGVFRVDQRFLD